MPNTSIQATLWSSDPQAWADDAEGRIRPLYKDVLARLHLGPGTRLLDAGCGAGLFAELAAGTGAEVTGLDAAAGLVEYARRHRPTVRYVVDDLQRMPFEDEAFDVVTAFNSVLYAADPHGALAEIARVTAPGGRLVVTVGAGPDQAESAALINPLARYDDVPDHAGFDLADPDTARRALLGAGFTAPRITDVVFDVEYANEHDAIAAQLPAGPVVAAIRHSGRLAVEATLRSFFAPRTRPNGSIQINMVFRCYFCERELPAAQRLSDGLS
ncbi:class I SAM-dependent methyltransferase [Kribbella sp. NPDC055071]